MTNATQTATTPTGRSGDLIYRFEARLGDLYPIGLFAEGIRFNNKFQGTIVAGPFEGADFWGFDEFLLRPDGIGEIIAPEIIDTGEIRVVLQVRGYVVPPEGMEAPPLEAVLTPGFAFPDVDFRVTGGATIKCSAPGYEWLNRTYAIVEGTVNMSTGALRVEARAA